MLRKYYENTRHYQCPECDTHITLSFWQWLFYPRMKFDITRHRYVKCPYCKASHWIQAEKAVK